MSAGLLQAVGVAVWLAALLVARRVYDAWERQRATPRRGIAPPARDAWRPLPPGSPGTLFGLPIREVEEVRLMPPTADTCGCCGQDCPPGAVWCLPCCEHVRTDGPIEERTYFAQYGRPCPHAPRSPGDQQDSGDCIPEGLGRRPPLELVEPRVPFRLLTTAEQDLWRDAMEARP